MWTATILVGVLGLGGPDAAAPPPAALPPPDAAAFFQKLGERYRKLSVYQDEAAVVEVVTRPDQQPHRVESRIACRLEGDRLTVQTPGAELRQGLSLEAPAVRSPAMETLVQRYNLWLAPHMVLHFAAEPLKELRLGVPQGFVPAGSEVVAGDKKPAVRLDLRSAEAPDPKAADAQALFSLWVDPESMLVQRIIGRQRLPDGAAYEVTLEIAPQRAE